MAELIVVILGLGLNFMITAGLIFLISWCFGFSVSWKIALGCWVLVALVRMLIGRR